MIMDERLEFADAASVIAGTGRSLIGDVVDTGNDGINDVDDMYLVVQVTTEVDSAAEGATISFELASDAAAAIATDGSATEHIVSEAILEATLVAGYQRVWHLPRGTYERYLGLIANIAGEAVTAGAINAFLTRTPPSWKSFPDATN